MPHDAPESGRASLVLRSLIASASTLLIAACVSFEHGISAGQVAERPLAAKSSEGAKRLAIESQYDSAVRDFVREHGEPDYLYVVDRDELYLFYTRQDMVALIRRELIPPGEVTKMGKIPGTLLTLLPRAEMDRISARRSQLRAAKKAAARSRPRALPAAPVPGPSEARIALGGFDTREIVESLRKPMSAADPGVPSWRHATASDGSAVRSGRAGTTHYQVSYRSVVVLTPIGPGRRSTPTAARVGYVRVNNAVFGSRAGAVSALVKPLVDQVVKDPTGKTRIARRIEGRTVEMARDAGRGLLVYSVRAH